MVQGLRLDLPMPGMQVQSLVGELRSLKAEKPKHKKKKRRRRKKRHPDWKRSKNYLTDNMILYLDNPKESTKN